MPGTGGGTLGRPERLPGSFAAYDRITGVGDADGIPHRWEQSTA